MKHSVWKSHTVYRFTTAAHFVLLFALVIIAAPIDESSHCIHGDSRLISQKFDNQMDNFSSGALMIGHFLAIIGCFHDDLLWISIICYKIMILLTMGLTLAQGMSGYMENCLNQFSMFIIAHVGMMICLFNLHVLFIYTHRGLTFYQWIPLKIRELYQSLIDRNRHPKDHLIQKITGIEYKKLKSEKVPLLEENHEQFGQMIEKTCVEVMVTVASMRHVDLASEIHGKAFNAVQDAYSDTRWERVRGAIFSDFGHGSRTSRDTMVSRLAEPARNVRRAIENLLALQRETDGVFTAADLIQQMRSADHETVVRAVKHVYAVSKHDGSIACKEMIDELLRVTRSGDPDLVRNAVGALSHISEHPDGRMLIFRSEGLAEIIRMLGSEDEAVVRYALTTLHRLLQHIERTRPMARQLGATPALTRLLEGWRMPKMLSMAADAVHILIFDDLAERNQFALDCDGARRLIRLLTTHEDQPKVVMTAVRCVRVLCAGQDASHLKHLLIEKDALFVLYTNLKKAEDARTRITILACLRNLSDAVSNEQDHAVIVIALLDIIKESERAMGGRPLQGYSEEEVMFAAGVLSNLTCNNVNNKATVYEANGIGTLVDALRLRPDKADEMVTEPALCTLRHCTARHGNASAAQRAFARVGGWGVVVKQLETLRPPVVKAALGVVRNAAIPRENRLALVESQLAGPLLAVTMEILTSAASELRMDVGATSDDGVSMWEIAEASGGALHQLAAHETVAGWLIEEQALLPVIKEILESDEAAAADEVMQRELLGVLYQMSKTEGGCARIEGVEIGGALQRALRSPHPSVVTYAAGVMKNLERGGLARRFNDDGTVYGTGNWSRGMGGISEYQSMGSELGDGYEPELFGAHAHHDAHHGGDNYGLDRIDHSFRMPHNNSDWFDTDL